MEDAGHNPPSTFADPTMGSPWFQWPSVPKMRGNFGCYNLARLGRRSGILPNHFPCNCNCISYPHEGVYGRHQEALSSISVSCKPSHGATLVWVSSSVWPSPWMVDIPVWEVDWYARTDTHQLQNRCVEDLYFHLTFCILFYSMCILVQGQLEQTISESFTRAANLRAFVYKTNQCPPAILHCQSIFRRLIDPRVRNTLTSDMMDFTVVEQPDVAVWNPMATSKVPSKLQTILRLHNNNAHVDRAQFLTNIIVHGLRYTTSTKSFGNSCVLLGLPSSDVKVPAVIDSILKIQTSADTLEILLAVRRYKALPNPCDGTSRFQEVGVSIWSSKLRTMRPSPLKPSG